MSTIAAPSHYTPEDLLTMPDGDRFELVNGQLVERNMSLWSSYIAGGIYFFLKSFVDSRKLGWVLPEGTSYQCFPDAPAKVRKPDTSFIHRDRLPLAQATAEGHVPISPDLAVEVVSPGDTAYEVAVKVQEFLTAGVLLVWVLNPANRSAEVHRPQGRGMILHENDELDGEDILPGFRCRVGDLFQPPPGVAAN